MPKIPPSTYFNEWESYPAAWLRNLYPGAAVDQRSISDLTGRDVAGFRRCHFFAGIGGWELALTMAGWPAAAPVWTGSCPCQPFSTAGKGRGVADERHLWPEFFRLIAERRPPVVFGEQVAGQSGLEWLSGVRADLESVGYAVGAADIPAPGVGAPHCRYRLFWGATIPTPVGNPHQYEQAAHTPVRAGEDVEPGGRVGDWDGYEIARCGDGFGRRVESGVLPLAHGVPGRVERLRAYGNAIVPQVAAVFIKSFMEVLRGVK